MKSGVARALQPKHANPLELHLAVRLAQRLKRLRERRGTVEDAPFAAVSVPRAPSAAALSRGRSASAPSHLRLMYSKVSRSTTATRCVLLNLRVFPANTA